MPTINQDLIYSKIESIKPMPQIVTKALAMAENPESPVEKIASLIQLDEAITVRILNLCNSAYFGLSKPCSSVKEAVVYLGMNNVINLLLTAVTGNYLSSRQVHYGLERGDLWKHSVAVAIGTQAICEIIQYRDKGKLFTAGLLHDVGKIILNDCMSGYVHKIDTLIEKQGYYIEEAESEVLGISHSEVGEILAQHWQLPEEICTLIRYHHQPDQAEQFVQECYIIHLSNHIVTNLKIGIGLRSQLSNLKSEILLHLGISMNNLNELSEDIQNRFDAAIDLVSL